MLPIELEVLKSQKQDFGRAVKTWDESRTGYGLPSEHTHLPIEMRDATVTSSTLGVWSRTT